MARAQFSSIWLCCSLYLSFIPSVLVLHLSYTSMLSVFVFLKFYIITINDCLFWKNKSIRAWPPLECIMKHLFYKQTRDAQSKERLFIFLSLILSWDSSQPTQIHRLSQERKKPSLILHFCQFWQNVVECNKIVFFVFNSFDWSIIYLSILSSFLFLKDLHLACSMHFLLWILFLKERKIWWIQCKKNKKISNSCYIKNSDFTNAEQNFSAASIRHLKDNNKRKLNYFDVLGSSLSFFF